MSIIIPIPQMFKRRGLAALNCMRAATTQLVTPQPPVQRYSLSFPPAGNSNLDVALGCGILNLVNWQFAAVTSGYGAL